MKKIATLLITVVLFLGGCGAQKNGNITFTGKIADVLENGILVTTEDDVGFDKAIVFFTEGIKIGFNLIEGQTVVITILPEIRESYPVQVTAVKIALKEQNDETENDEMTKDSAKYQKITPKEARDLIGSDEPIVILDVRTESEYAEGHIKNSILIPDTELKKTAAKKLPDKDARILVYCRSGRRSKESAEALMAMGYTDVYDFGGIIDWPYEIVK